MLLMTRTANAKIDEKKKKNYKQTKNPKAKNKLVPIHKNCFPRLLSQQNHIK